MEDQQLEDWVDILDTTNYAPHKDPDNLYQSYRFVDLDINSVTTKNYRKKICESLIEQVEIFIPPSLATLSKKPALFPVDPGI